MILILLVTMLFPIAGHSLPDDEKQRVCAELSRSVLPVQRPTALIRCVEFANNDCDRIERSLNETCLEGSHSDNAIKYDFQRGTASACQAALIKRDTQKIFCDGLRNECRELSVAMGGGGAEARCNSFRNEENKKLCVAVEAQAERIVNLEVQEKQKCAQLSGTPLKAPVKSKGN
ncbi:MAG: hypothetical protein HC883_05335 [Bdellovibrionaceae bacterium]|nr:hypothetical protein [Pseudobdellovibrionaceae bacterium]